MSLVVTNYTACDRCCWCYSIRPIQEIGPRPRTRKREKIFSIMVNISLVGTISVNIIKIVATRYPILKRKCTKYAGGTYSAHLALPLAWLVVCSFFSCLFIVANCSTLRCFNQEVTLELSHPRIQLTNRLQLAYRPTSLCHRYKLVRIIFIFQCLFIFSVNFVCFV